MKLYYMDKALWLIAMIGGILFGVYILREEILPFWIPFYGLLTGFQAKELLLLPIDYFIGPRERIMYFWCRGGDINLDFFSKKKSSAWYFIYSEKGKNYKIRIIIPVALTEDEIGNIEQFQTHEKIRVRYYTLSKILCEWERVK